MIRDKIGRAVVILGLATGLLAPRSAQADILCTWFGRCLFESPGFRITVIDKDTGQPLAEVHALAEWVQHGAHGRNGPLMVQDALSGPDGVLTFPAWGPSRGTRLRLILNVDPAVSLFKPGYQTLLIHNAYPSDTTETTRVRHFGQDGQTVALEPFRGSLEDLLLQLDKAAFPGTTGRKSEEQLLQFKPLYLNRRRRVWNELQGIPRTDQAVEHRVRSFERDLRYLEQLGQ